MYPYVHIFGKNISMYGMMVVAGFLMSLIMIGVVERKNKKRREDAVYIYTLGAVGALIGAKALYLLTVMDTLIADLSLIRINFAAFQAKYISGGMIFYGGLAGGILAAVLTARSYRVRLRDYYLPLLPGIAILSGFGRIGCFFAGCCYGKATQAWFGVKLPYSPYAPHDVPLIPTQLIEAGCDFALCIFITWLVRKGCRDIALFVYLMIYAAYRFVIECFRGDLYRGIYGPFSLSQWVSLGVIVLCVILLYCSICRPKKPAAV